MDDEIRISKAQLTEWAESLIHMNHHGTLVQREIASGNTDRASHLSERARKRAWKMLNELFEYGAEKPEGYCEPDSVDTEKDIKKNLARQHIIEGLLKARRDADNILKVLKTEEDPKLYLVADLLYSPHQAQSILELNRPINQIDEDFLVAEQNKLKRIEAELNARHNQEEAPA